MVVAPVYPASVVQCLRELPPATRPRAVYSIDQILGTSRASVDDNHLHQIKDALTTKSDLIRSANDTCIQKNTGTNESLDNQIEILITPTTLNIYINSLQAFKLSFRHSDRPTCQISNMLISVLLLS
ncbi:hypothetical protein L9F63_012890, partial [Diploptera punctata]